MIASWSGRFDFSPNYSLAAAGIRTLAPRDASGDRYPEMHLRA